MASKVYLYDIDLDGNKLLNTLIDPVEEFPETPIENQVVTKDGVIYLRHAGQWVAIGAKIGQFQDGFDADTSTELPSPSIKGDYWFVEVAGTVNAIFAEALEIGTMIVAKVDSADPNDPNDWVVLKMGGGVASIGEYGLIKLASVAETREGIDDTKAVTPASLAGMKADQDDVKDPLETDRFVTPESLHKLTASETQQGLSRFATSTEVGEGTKTNVKVNPKGIKDNTVEKELRNIHNVNLLHVNLVAPDLSVWRVTVDTGGFLQTELIDGGS